MARRKRTASVDFAVEPTTEIENLKDQLEVTPEPTFDVEPEGPPEAEPEVTSEAAPEEAPAPYTEAMAADDTELLAGVVVEVTGQPEASKAREPVRQPSKTVKKRQRNHLRFVR